MTVIRNVTAVCQTGYIVPIMTDTRNACHFCKTPIPYDVPLWRIIVRTGEIFRVPDGRYYLRKAKVSACRACAIREGRTNVEFWADQPMGPPAEPTPAQIYDWERMHSNGWYDFTPGEPNSRCMGCGRTLGRECSWPERVCSLECARDTRNARRRVKRDSKECATCHDMFIPARADSLYCTAKCRQKAYRLRGVRNTHSSASPLARSHLSSSV